MKVTEKLDTRRVLVAFLIRECQQARYNVVVPDDPKYYTSPHPDISFYRSLEKAIHDGGKISSNVTKIYDGFAMICQMLGIFGDEYFYWRDMFFIE